jgi:hypothetical protein
MSAGTGDTTERDSRLREWCEREAQAAEVHAQEAERIAKAWREAAAGLRRTAEALKP